MTAPLVFATASPALAGCTALDYQAALTASAAALRATPPDLAVARADITALLKADPHRSAVLQPVLDDLSTSPPGLDDARTRLTSLSATLTYPPDSTCNVSSGAARGALHDIYSSPPLNHLDDNRQTGFLTAILDFLSTVFSGTAGALGAVGMVLVAIAVLALAVLLAWRRWHGSAAFRGADIAEPATAGDDPDAEWRAALHAAAGDDHREAVRRAFRSALLEVALRGHLHIDAAWTTRELLLRCQADGDVLIALAAAAALFEHAWYSGVVVSAADWEAAAERSAAVRRLARRAGAVHR